jgi:hypothetical protein
MRKKQNEIMITTFYSKGKAVWRVESPGPLMDAEIERWNTEIKEMGKGVVDAITDNKGNMVTFTNGSFLKEVEG